MPDWSLVETTVEEWVETVTGLTAIWKDRPQDKPYDEAGYAELFIDSEVTIGGDFIVTEYDPTQPNEEEIRTYARGDRTFVLQIRINTWIGNVDHDAKHYASLLRKSVGLPVITGAKLEEANIAISNILLDQSRQITQGNRALSVHQFDLLMLGMDEAEDTKGQWIEQLADVEAQYPEGQSPPTWTGDIDLP